MQPIRCRGPSGSIDWASRAEAHSLYPGGTFTFAWEKQWIPPHFIIFIYLFKALNWHTCRTCTVVPCINITINYWLITISSKASLSNAESSTVTACARIRMVLGKLNCGLDKTDFALLKANKTRPLFKLLQCQSQAWIKEEGDTVSLNWDYFYWDRQLLKHNVQTIIRTPSCLLPFYRFNNLKTPRRFYDCKSLEVRVKFVEGEDISRAAKEWHREEQIDRWRDRQTYRQTDRLQCDFRHERRMNE